MRSDPTIASRTRNLGGMGVGDVISGQLSKREQLEGQIVAGLCHILPKITPQGPAAGHQGSSGDK